MSLVSFPSWGLTWDDLFQRNGLFFEPFSDVPFSGKIEGFIQGRIENGIREGYWVFYHRTGQLSLKGNYKNGKMEGSWEGYNRDGTVNEEYTGTFKNDVKVSD